MDTPDPDVVRRAVAGDPVAVTQVLTQIRPIVVRYSLARLGHVGAGGATAEDVAQEVCLAVLRALPRFSEQGRPFLAFVYGIAARKVADACRAASRDRTESVADVPDTADPTPGPEPQALAADLGARLAGLLAQLPATHREILVLRLAVGMTADEVGTVLGMTGGAVRLAQHRALTRLRALADDTLATVIR
ncbi:RNA polymerase sigma-70 factor, ECF subfamily [Micromonospora rhizosphaerae]|uniref:RNA polymerase sigma-70 factor, ECF subfamily n=1 Tax=Micromonospora rhizosphaerae TaxID=568872 RepID=A0A1C6S2H2_9ACTN|nr:RNA polymerase sigma factor ShbA [Micromonospora rhizosphaerae]SCL23598.1 RNA polymerase sigma-70 factor, ECF subfamily [Micromonospora rhizosphaerae]